MTNYALIYKPHQRNTAFTSILSAQNTLHNDAVGKTYVNHGNIIGDKQLHFYHTKIHETCNEITISQIKPE